MNPTAAREILDHRHEVQQASVEMSQEQDAENNIHDFHENPAGGAGLEASDASCQRTAVWNGSPRIGIREFTLT